MPAPDSYTPKHLAEKILTSRSAIEGERKVVTVLFCRPLSPAPFTLPLPPPPAILQTS